MRLIVLLSVEGPGGESPTYNKYSGMRSPAWTDLGLTLQRKLACNHLQSGAGDDVKPAGSQR